MMTARILCVGGSDSGAGAGIQADLKTITMLGGYAMTAITALTAQNTCGVADILLATPHSVCSQINAVIRDIGVDAIKIGMIGSAAIAHAVADQLAPLRIERPNLPLIVDPVMVATSGAALADDETIVATRRLMALATLITPNLPELAALGGEDILRSAGQVVLIKGGHGEGDIVTDRLVGPNGEIARWSDGRIVTPHTHGTGCTLASAIACGLGQGRAIEESVARARAFVRLALRDAPGLGAGNGPMGHHMVRLDAGPPMRLNQITMGLSNYTASVDFYTALGLKLIVDAPPDYARFEAGGGTTFSIHRGMSHAQADDTTVYFECDALDTDVVRLKTLGHIFEHDPIDQGWLWREARLRDPFGNIICLYQAGEMRRYPPWRC